MMNVGVSCQEHGKNAAELSSRNENLGDLKGPRRGPAPHKSRRGPAPKPQQTSVAGAIDGEFLGTLAECAIEVGVSILEGIASAD